jgi:hypothetical protein
MLRPQISGLDQFRDHLVGKRNAFAHLLWSALYVTAGRTTSVPKATDFEGAASAPFSFARDEPGAQPVPGSDMKLLREFQRLQQHLRGSKCVPAPAFAFEASYDFPLAGNVTLTFGDVSLGLLDGSDRRLEDSDAIKVAAIKRALAGKLGVRRDCSGSTNRSWHGAAHQSRTGGMRRGALR